MNLLRLALSGWKLNRSTNIALLLAVATTTTVLTGALLVGDSVTGSLRDLILGRLGRVDQMVLTDVFFGENLSAQLQNRADFNQNGMLAESVILARGSLKNPGQERIVSEVTVFGCDDSFWQLGEGGPVVPPQSGEIVLTDRLASKAYLDARVGDRVIVQLGQPQLIPGESPLGRKTETVRRRAWNVVGIVSADGIGGFSLSPSQQRPLNAFVGRTELAEMLDQHGKVNLLLIGREQRDSDSSFSVNTVLLSPQLKDYGLELQSITKKSEDSGGYTDLTAERMMLPRDIQVAAEKVWTEKDKPQAALTYLANWIKAGSRSIPYSTVTAIDSIEAIGPLLLPDGRPLLLADDEIVLNSWAAKELDAQPGDPVEITYFDPETTHGQVEERTADFRLHSIVSLYDAEKNPTLVNDRNLTPELAGVTDQESIDAWDPPFPFDATRVRDQDESYWDHYRATPKAFISRQRGDSLWGSRFGNLTSLRVPRSKAETPSAAQLRLQSRLEEELNRSERFAFRDLRKELLGAAGGTTPFGLLFLCFSLFLIVSSLALLTLLFRLDVDQRATEWSLFSAIGFTRARILQLLFLQTFFLVGAGGIIGLACGIIYAAIMVFGLQTWWVQAVTTPFVHLHLSFGSIVSGYVASGVACFLAILWSFRLQRRATLQWRLSSNSEMHSSLTSSQHLSWWCTFFFLLTSVFVIVAIFGPPFLRTGLFFGAGSSALLTGITFLGGLLHRIGADRQNQGMKSLYRLVGVSLSRQPQRSLLTIGLVGAATFMIVAVSAFRLEQRNQGQFSLIAESVLPLYFDLGTVAGREEYGLTDRTEGSLENTTFVSLRAHGGDDASCLNLYRARQPKLLGVPREMPADFFVEDLGDKSWNILGSDLGDDESGKRIVPVVLDQNTARYGLGLYGGVGEQFEVKEQDRTTTFQVVALLKNSFFQGALLLGEDELLRLYPETEGYQYFLIDASEAALPETATMLEDQLADFGFDVQPVADRLAMLYGVQNTYLAAFQTLGGLGLLLGTLGLLAVQVRNIFSRRHEFALQQALGFSNRRLSLMLIFENMFLLSSGLLLGMASACVAILPHLLDEGIRVPLFATSGLLMLVLLIGLSVGLFSVRQLLRAVPIAILRGE